MLPVNVQGEIALLEAVNRTPFGIPHRCVKIHDGHADLIAEVGCFGLLAERVKSRQQKQNRNSGLIA